MSQGAAGVALLCFDESELKGWTVPFYQALDFLLLFFFFFLFLHRT